MKAGQPHVVGVLAQLLEPLPTFPFAVCVVRRDLSWLPDDEESPAARAAVNACCGCPHVAACAAFALAHPDLPGIWGGLTTAQRRAMTERAEGPG